MVFSVGCLSVACGGPPPPAPTPAVSPPVSAASVASVAPPPAPPPVASAAPASPPPSLFDAPASRPLDDGGALPSSVWFRGSNDTHALLRLEGQQTTGRGVVVDLTTGCLVESWPAIDQDVEIQYPSLGSGLDESLTVFFDVPGDLGRAGMKPTPTFRSQLAHVLGTTSRFFHPGNEGWVDRSWGDVAFTSDRRSILIDARHRAYLSRDGGERFSPVLPDPTGEAFRSVDARFLDDRTLLLDVAPIELATGRWQHFVAPVDGSTKPVRLPWGEREQLVGLVGTVAHLLSDDEWGGPTKKVCTKTIDLAKPSQPPEKGVCFALPKDGGQLGVPFRSLGLGAFTDAATPGFGPPALTLVDFAKGTVQRRKLDRKTRVASVFVDATGGIAWTGADGITRITAPDGKTREVAKTGVAVGWAPASSKRGLIIVDTLPRGGTLRDHRCSLVQTTAR